MRLASIIVFLPGNVPVGSDQLVMKAMKSFFKLRPPLPKYLNTFDVTIVMQYVMDMGPAADLDLKCLTYKTLFLVAFSTLSRYWHSAFLLSLLMTLKSPSSSTVLHVMSRHWTVHTTG